MSQKSVEFLHMSDATVASELIRRVVPADAGQTIGERILRTARELGWPYARTANVWRRRARRVDAHEMDQLRTASERKAKQLEEARHEYRELQARLGRMEAALARLDEDFHRPTIDALGAQMRAGGRVDSA